MPYLNVGGAWVNSLSYVDDMMLLASTALQTLFHKSPYSLMNRITASFNSVVTAIVNSDAYQQSALMDKWKSMLYV